MHTALKEYILIYGRYIDFKSFEKNAPEFALFWVEIRLKHFKQINISFKFCVNYGKIVVFFLTADWNETMIPYIMSFDTTIPLLVKSRNEGVAKCDEENQQAFCMFACIRWMEVGLEGVQHLCQMTLCSESILQNSKFDGKWSNGVRGEGTGNWPKMWVRVKTRRFW